MENGDTTSEDSSEAQADDAAAAMWGARRARGTPGPADAPPVDIWGSAPAATEGPSDPDPADPPPDLWGDGPAPRESRERTEGKDRSARFVLPPTWAATPKRKPGWILRRRRS
jgi:hypothetical protein